MLTSLPGTTMTFTTCLPPRLVRTLRGLGRGIAGASPAAGYTYVEDRCHPMPVGEHADPANKSILSRRRKEDVKYGFLSERPERYTEIPRC